jgi:alpha-galactosidase
LFNRQRSTEQMTVKLSLLGIEGEASVRDLWLKKDLRPVSGAFSAFVPSHGVVMVRFKAM